MPPRPPACKVKINTVALHNINEQEIPDLIRFAHDRGADITLIETMPMGEAETDRVEDFCRSTRSAPICRSSSR